MKAKRTKPILAWHWLSADGKMANTGEVVEAGKTYTVEPPITCCERGLHASIKAIDSLHYAPGPIICRVEMSGEIASQEDKLAASSRKVIWMADADKVLRPALSCPRRSARLSSRRS